MFKSRKAIAAEFNDLIMIPQNTYGGRREPTYYSCPVSTHEPWDTSSQTNKQVNLEKKNIY